MATEVSVLRLLPNNNCEVVSFFTSSQDDPRTILEVVTSLAMPGGVLLLKPRPVLRDGDIVQLKNPTQEQPEFFLWDGGVWESLPSLSREGCLA